MTIGGIDLGSRWLAPVVAEDALPLRLAAPPQTLQVDPENPEIVVGVVVELFVAAGVTRAAVEFGRFYAGESPTPGQATATANAWGVMLILKHLFQRELAAVGIELIVMERRTWSSRLVPHHKGGVKTAESNDAIRARCADGVYEQLSDQHQRDAAGVLLGAWLIDAEPRRRRYKYRDRRKDKRTPRTELTEAELAERKAKRHEYQIDWQRAQRATVTPEARRALGCGCLLGHNGGGRHRKDCPLAPLPKFHVGSEIRKWPYRNS